MNQPTHTDPTGPDAGIPRPQLRNIFRIAVAAVAATVTGTLAQAVVVPTPPIAPGAPVQGPTTLPLNVVVVPMTDTIPGNGENIRFAGQASFSAQLIDDLLTKAPRVLELIIDFSGVTATGVTSGKQYITAAQSIVRRPAKPFETVEVSFPYYISGNLQSARVAMAAFSFGLDRGMLSITSKLSTPA